MTMSGYYNSINDPYSGPVCDFMVATGQAVAVSLDRDTPPELIELRLRLLMEEIDELWEAINLRDAEMVAKEWADAVYVLFGLAIAFRITTLDIFTAVAQSNATKINPDTGKPYKVVNGKVVKTEEYTPAEPAVHEIMRSSQVSV